jgi:hypothetical protein
MSFPLVLLDANREIGVPGILALDLRDGGVLRSFCPWLLDFWAALFGNKKERLVALWANFY